MLLAGATALSGAAQSKFDAAGMMVMHTYAARLQNPTAELPQLDIPVSYTHLTLPTIA